MTLTLNLDSILQQIADGHLDAGLNRLAEQIEMRRAAIPLRVGDLVTFNEKCGTRYLVGQDAEVVALPKGRSTKYSVRLRADFPIGRFPAGCVIKSPRSILDPGASPILSDPAVPTQVQS